MVGNNGLQQRELKRIPKADLSWNCRLQLAYMNVELLVTVGQHTTVNTFSGLVHTARQVMEVGNAWSRWANPLGGRRREWDWWLGLSRNKVAVAEAAAGSPPFKGAGTLDLSSEPGLSVEGVLLTFDNWVWSLVEELLSTLWWYIDYVNSTGITKPKWQKNFRTLGFLLLSGC